MSSSAWLRDRAILFGLSLGQLSSKVWATVACLKLQTSVLNGKSTFVSCFLIIVDGIQSNDGPWKDLGTH